MAAALDDLALDYGNFRAVLRWAVETGDLTSGLRLAGALYGFWIARGHLTEARGWLESALPRSQAVPDQVRGAALRVAGVFAGIQHDHTRAAASSRRVWRYGKHSAMWLIRPGRTSISDWWHMSPAGSTRPKAN
jgi:hypothetical protein